MSNPMEGRKMDPKLVEILERNKVEREHRQSSATPVAEKPIVSEPAATAPVQEKKEKRPRDFPTFIERSLPPGDRE